MFRRSICAWALAVMVALGVTGLASAHAILVRTEPSDGAVLARPPRQAELWFSEAVVLKFTSLSLVGSDGREVSLPHLRSDPADPKVVIADLPTLAPKAYRLVWRTLSDDDLHPSTGSIVFGVQQAANLAPIETGASTPQVSEVMLRWLNFLALAGLIGSLSVALLVLPAEKDVSNLFSAPQTTARLRRHLLKMALWSAALALIAGAGLLFVQANGDGGAMLQVLAQTGFGAHWLMREAWLIAIIVLLMLYLRGHVVPDASSHLLLAVMTPLIGALVISQALTSHAAAVSDDSFIPVIVDALHLLAASVWVGGLCSLAITIVPLLRRGPVEKVLARTILRRFSILAVSSVAILAITGLLSSGEQVASLDALLFTLYGRSLLLKTTLVMGVLLIALINSALVHPRVADLIRRVLRRPIGWTPLPARFLWRTIVLESIGAAIVVLFAALLTASPPARAPELNPVISETAVAPSLSTMVADLLVTFSIRPNHPGQNFVEAGVFNTRRPPPAPIERVTVKLAPPSTPGEAVTLAAQASPDGRYEFPSSAITSTGDWEVTVIIKRSGLPDAIVKGFWTVTPPGPAIRAPVVISNRPLAPWTILLAILIGAGLSVSLITVGVRRAARSPALPNFHQIDTVHSAPKE